MPISPAQSHAQEDTTSLPKLDSTDHAPPADERIKALEYSDSDDSLSTSDTDTDSEPLSDLEGERRITKVAENIIELIEQINERDDAITSLVLPFLALVSIIPAIPLIIIMIIYISNRLNEEDNKTPQPGVTLINSAIAPAKDKNLSA